MLENIAIGSKIEVKIVNAPTNTAAKKTLERVLGKADDVKAADRIQGKIRKKNYRPRMRGGRLYSGRVPRQQLVNPIVGTSKQILASYDVLQDLGSVKRFIEVAAV